MKSLLTSYSSTSECVIKISFVAFALAVTCAGVYLSRTIALGELRQIGAQRLELYASSLRGVLDRYEYLPFILSRNKDVIRLLENPDDKLLQNMVNRLLEETNQVAGSAELFIMDASGRTIVASNWQETLTYIGHTYAFRPYFQLAILGSLVRYFAIGVTTGRPGFFLSWPIWRDDDLLGVAVVKVNLDPLQNDWTAAGDNIIVTDSDQIIFLSSRPTWRYTSLGNISATVHKRLDETRTYHGVEIKPLEIVNQEGVDPKTRILTIREPVPGSEENQQTEISYLAQSVSLSRVNWQIHILSNLAPVQRSEQAHIFNSAQAVRSHLTPGFPDVLVTDVKMPGMDGLALMKEVFVQDPDIPVVLITAHGDIAMAVQAMRDGAYDFIEKPFSPERFIDTVRRAWEKRRLVMDNRRLREKLCALSDTSDCIIGTSAKIQQLRNDIAHLAGIDADVLIQGETGCGKGLIAHCLHKWSARSDRKFVTINCGAIPETMFESELFGFEAGAFTNAVRRRVGRLEYAQHGTLFLDEIENLPLYHQVKLLTALEDRSIERLGSNQAIDLDVCIIAATEVNLREASEAGRFRADLYYRLNVAELVIPPLRERREDIPFLFEFFLGKTAGAHEHALPSLTPEDLRALVVYPWPGNVRELRNIAERYALGIGVKPGQIENVLRTPQMPTANSSDKSNRPLYTQLKALEHHIIEQAMIRHKGNLKGVMKELHLPRRTLALKLSKHKLNRKNYIEGH